MPTPEQDETRREFARMVRSRDYATIEEVARSAGLLALTEEVHRVDPSSRTNDARRDQLPSRR